MECVEIQTLKARQLPGFLLYKGLLIFCSFLFFIGFPHVVNRFWILDYTRRIIFGNQNFCIMPKKNWPDDDTIFFTVLWLVMVGALIVFGWYLLNELGK